MRIECTLRADTSAHSAVLKWTASKFIVSTQTIISIIYANI